MVHSPINTSEKDATRKRFSDRWRVLLMGLLLTVVTLAVFAQTRHFEFISYDDPLYTTANEMVSQGLSTTTVIWAFTDATDYSNYWAPLTWITFLIDHELFGLQPGGYHLTNVLFHVLNALLLFTVFVLMHGGLWKSFLLALFFAIHPLHVESVAWVAERKDVVSTFFWMLTLIAYAQYVRKPGVAGYIFVFLMFIGCIMGKPMGVTAPFVLLLLDYWPLARFGTAVSPRSNEFWRAAWRLTREKLPLFAVVAIIVPLTYYTQDKAAALKPLADISFVTRVQNVGVTYAGQILKTFWPVHLGILYPYPDQLPAWQPVVALILLVIVTWAVFSFRHRGPYLLVGWLWFLGTFVPVAGFVVIGPHVTADRYTYIPLIGFFIMVIWSLDGLRRYWKIDHKIFICGIIGISVLLAVLAHRQVSRWENSIAIYTHTLAVTRENWPVHLNLGAAYRETGQDARALDQYRRALQINSRIAEVHLSVGEVLVAMGRTREARDHYAAAVTILPESTAIHSAYATVLDKNGETDRAILHFHKALEIDKQNSDAHHGLGVTLFRLGQLDKAAGHYQRALELDPGFALAHYNFGAALAAKGDLPNARRRFEMAVLADPELVEPYVGLGVLDLRAGDRKAASNHFAKALQIDPDHGQAREGMRRATAKQ